MSLLDPAFRMPGAPPLPSIRGNELLFVLPIQLNGQPGSTLASITTDQLAAFGGGGGTIPNNSVLGNISGVPGVATPLSAAQLTNLINVFGPTTAGAVPAPGAADPGTNVLLSSGAWGSAASSIGTYPAAQPGLVPAPLTAPLNAALQADGTWRVPGTVYRQIGDSNYTALPQDDWVYLFVSAPSQSFAFTLPDFATTPAAKQLRVTISFMQFGVGPYLGCSYSINTGGVPLYTSTTRASPDSINGIVLQGPPVGPAQVNLFFIKTNGAWYMYNFDIPLLGTTGGFPIGMPGLLPGPPAGTASNAALMADMTWKVPGTNTVITSADYTALATDDVIVYTSVPVTRTLALPDANLVPGGKVVRIIAANFGGGAGIRIDAGTSLITSPFYGGAGWLYLNEITINSNGPLAGAGGGNLIVELVKVTSTPNRWYLINGAGVLYGTDVGLNSRPLLGLMPPPPLGTLSNAALQADMTWKVPGTQRPVVSSDYNILSTDDFIQSTVATGTTVTLTLPVASSAPAGKRIKIYARINGNGSIRITATPPDYFGVYSKGPVAGYPGTPAIFATPGTGRDIVITGDGSPYGDYLFETFIVSGSWAIYSLGFSVNGVVTGGGAVTLPGLLPTPPAGTASNAALQADMTWKVPGTNTQVVGTAYNIIPTDDWIIINNVNYPFTLTLSDATASPRGKIIRITMAVFSAGGSLIITPFGSQAINLTTVPIGWTLGGVVTITPPTSGNSMVELFLINTGGNWWLSNRGLPLPATITGGSNPGTYSLPGLIPGPPAGTPATAVLHADMTWY